jgi:hypothetical protein
VGAGGGGGGSSSAPADATFTTGVGTFAGQVTISWDAPAPAPDAQIRVGDSGPFVGVGVLPPAPQTVTAQVAPGATQVLEVRVANTGTRDTRFALSGPTERSGFSTRYLDGNQDVTDGVGNGTYAPTIASGSSTTLTVRVTAPSAINAVATMPIIATSFEDPSRFDRVEAELSTAPATRSGGPLARTGLVVARVLGLAALLVALGAFLVRLRPRARDQR